MAWFDNMELYDSEVMDDMYAQAVYDSLEQKDRTNVQLFNDIADYCSVGADGGFDKHPPLHDVARMDLIKSNLIQRLKVCVPFSDDFDPEESVNNFDPEVLLSAVQAYYEAPDGLPVDEFVDASFRQDGYVTQLSFDVIREKIRWTEKQENGQEVLDRVLQSSKMDGYDDLLPHEQMAREAFGRTFARLIEQSRYASFDTGILGGVDVSKGVGVGEAQAETVLEHMVEDEHVVPKDEPSVEDEVSQLFDELEELKSGDGKSLDDNVLELGE